MEEIHRTGTAPENKYMERQPGKRRMEERAHTPRLSSICERGIKLKLSGYEVYYTN
jgi:hypothetical protein